MWQKLLFFILIENFFNIFKMTNASPQNYFSWIGADYIRVINETKLDPVGGCP